MPVSDEIVLENITYDPVQKTYPKHSGGGSKLRSLVNEIIVQTTDELYE